MGLLNFIMEYPLRFSIEKWKWLCLVVLVATTHLFCQTLMLPYGSALLSLLPGADTPLRGEYTFSSRLSYAKPILLGDPLVNASEFVDMGRVKVANNGNVGGGSEEDGIPSTDDKGRESGFALDGAGLDDNPLLDEDMDTDDDFPLENNVDVDEEFLVESVKDQDDGLILEKTSKTPHGLPPEQTVKLSDGISVKGIPVEDSRLKNMKLSVSTLADSNVNKWQVKHIQVLPINENQMLFQDDDDTASSNDSTVVKSKTIKKRMRCNMPPKTVTSLYQMNRLLVRHRTSSRAMRPRWSSVHDKEIVAAKLQITAASSVKNDQELYAPLFRNASMFRRSYELMERTLKVYIYKDGEKPIFHQPILKGLYASEGWFMKLMEGNKRFVVKDPKKAHLFYMPFSSRMLEHTLYVRNSHNRTNLRQYLKNYAEKIAAKYPFWNRTGGADHFLVACHDWAPYETRHHMEHCIKALCNADVTVGFKIGRDISLPEAYVRSARDPLRDLGGKPASERHIFAFYAGNMHGYLRQILLKFWNNKDPDMKIFGPMPPGVASKMNYIEHMKSSKYCICPKGYEVNSPRVVEAIFYECVPVIISDNFVPPFFEVLDWDAFAVIMAEKDIPNLKDILLSIPPEKYLKMQLGVRKVQQHFLWHVKPIKYDLFHMTLHSIWFNRVFQFKPR